MLSLKKKVSSGCEADRFLIDLPKVTGPSPSNKRHRHQSSIARSIKSLIDSPSQSGQISHQTYLPNSSTNSMSPAKTGCKPASRFSVNRTRNASTQWRAVASQAKYSTVDDLGEPMPPIVPNEKMDSPLPDAVGIDGATDWSKSYFGLSSQPFAKDIADVLMSPLESQDVEVKPGKHFRT
jgi:hypothetical protein